MLFTDADIALRYADLFRMADDFCLALNEQEAVAAEIDPRLLYHVVVAAYDDIARYKEYHLAEPARQRANGVKRAAYLARWITHFSPVIFPTVGHISGSTVKQHSPLVNVTLAVHVALTSVQQYVIDTLASEGEAAPAAVLTLSTETSYSLTYDLLYRNLTSDSLILLFEAIADLATSRDVVSWEA